MTISVNVPSTWVVRLVEFLRSPLRLRIHIEPSVGLARDIPQPTYFKVVLGPDSAHDDPQLMDLDD